MSAHITLSSEQTPAPAKPVEAISAILDAFNDHSLVGLSDAHGNQQAHEFLLSLIRHPRFAATVNDIVVEFGTARYQDVMDRFVHGEDIPGATLRKAWQDAVQPSAEHERGHAEAVFRAVKTVNAALPRERHVRVLLGDPPIKWEDIRTPADHRRWGEMRDWHPAALIQVEVLAKQRRALIVYGHGHLARLNPASNYDMTDWRAQSLVSLIERSSPTKVFTIFRDTGGAQFQPDVTSWPKPSVALIRGTVLGAIDATNYYDWGGRFAIRDGKMVKIPKEEWRKIPAEQQLDAILYLGSPSEMTDAKWPPALCADAEYMKMRLARMVTAGLPPTEQNALTSYCNSLTK